MRTLLVATTNPGKLREIRALMSDCPVRAREPCRRSTHRGTGGNRHDLRGERAAQGALLRRAQRAAGPWRKIPASSSMRSAASQACGQRAFFVPMRRTRNDSPKSSAASMHRPGQPRTARFVAALASVDRGEVIYETTGVVEGAIADAPRGRGGFGYDPIFYLPALRTDPRGSQRRREDCAWRIAASHFGSLPIG